MFQVIARVTSAIGGSASGGKQFLGHVHGIALSTFGELAMNANKEYSMLIEMKVTGLTIDPFTSMPIIILKDLEEKSALPIWVGLIEASAIATELENIKLSRPMTHDLIKNMLASLSVKVEKVTVTDLHDNTFFAHIILKQGEKEIDLDSRPSDAIALALRTKAPIFVEKKVIDKSRKIDLAKEGIDESGAKEQKWAEILENLSPEDFGKYKM